MPPTALPLGSDEDEDESRTPLTDRQPQYNKPSAVVKPSQLTEVVGISEEEFLYLTTYFMHGTSTGLLDQFSFKFTLTLFTLIAITPNGNLETVLITRLFYSDTI